MHGAEKVTTFWLSKMTCLKKPENASIIPETIWERYHPPLSADFLDMMEPHEPATPEEENDETIWEHYHPPLSADFFDMMKPATAEEENGQNSDDEDESACESYETPRRWQTYSAVIHDYGYKERLSNGAKTQNKLFFWGLYEMSFSQDFFCSINV